MNSPARIRFERPLLKRYEPNRAASNFYKAAVDDPSAIGGIPLDSVEAAVTAAVRLGYKVAEAQVERSARLAKRFREAGDRTTGGSSDEKRSDKQALDATEQIIFKTMMAGLGWLEGAAADRGNPVRRLATAQFQLLGSMLGLLPAEAPGAGETHPPDEPSPAERGGAAMRSTGTSEAGTGRTQPLIKHDKAANGRRPVRVVEWELSSETREGTFELTFYGSDSGSSTFRGRLHSGRAGRSVLTVRTSLKTPTGLYKAAICDDAGVQVGYIELTV